MLSVLIFLVYPPPLPKTAFPPHPKTIFLKEGGGPGVKKNIGRGETYIKPPNSPVMYIMKKKAVSDCILLKHQYISLKKSKRTSIVIYNQNR